jgi:hypothetical protein
MSPATPIGFDELNEDDEQFGRREMVHPESYRRRVPSKRPKMRARRSRSNEMAKRGIHQRRSKRTNW